MILLDEWIMNKWAYYQCIEGNNTKEMRQLITKSYYAYQYCLHIEDIEEMWKKITHPNVADLYCYYIKKRPEVEKYIDKDKFDIKELR